MATKAKFLRKETPKIAVLVECLQSDLNEIIAMSKKFDLGFNSSGVRARVKLQKSVYDIKLVRIEILRRIKDRNCLKK